MLYVLEQLLAEAVDILLTDLFAQRVHAFICNFPPAVGSL